MRRSIARLLGLAATSSLAILWLIAVPTASAGDPCYHGFEMPTTTTVEEANQIKMMPCAFGPTIAHVAVGSKVTFFNGPDLTHLVTGANQAWGSRDLEIPPGGTVSYTFDKEGVYPYACALHRGMSGAIIVGNAVAANTGGGGAAGAGAVTTNTTPATVETAGTGALDGLALLAIAVIAGMIVGAAVVVVALRRRRSDEEPATPQAV